MHSGAQTHRAWIRKARACSTECLCQKYVTACLNFTFWTGARDMWNSQERRSVSGLAAGGLTARICWSSIGSSMAHGRSDVLDSALDAPCNMTLRAARCPDASVSARRNPAFSTGVANFHLTVVAYAWARQGEPGACHRGTQAKGDRRLAD